jgi:hypothetical protein
VEARVMDAQGEAFATRTTQTAVDVGRSFVTLDFTADDVTGTLVDAHIHEDGHEEDAPVDLSTSTVAALVPDGAGGFTTFAGSGARSGAFSVPGVPHVEFYLRIGERYFVTALRSIALRTPVAGRPGVVAAQSGSTRLVFRADGLEPWQGGDELELSAFGAGLLIHSLQLSLSPALADGATALGGQAVAWAGGPLLTSADRLRVVQLGLVTTGAAPYLAATRVLEAAPFDQVDGAETGVDGGFTAPVLRGTTDIHWKWTAFEALRARVHPAAISAGSALRVAAAPALSELGVFYDGVPLVQVENPDGGTDIDLPGVSYEAVFPDGWGIFGDVAHDFQVTRAVPGAFAVSATVSISQSAPGGAFASGSIGPQLGPPESVLIAGQDAWSEATGVGTSPTVSWSPPSLGTATLYTVEVSLLTASGGTTERRSLATIYTSGTSVVLPPGVLAAAEWHDLVVTALSGVAPEDPLVLPATHARAAMISARFHP